MQNVEEFKKFMIEIFEEGKTNIGRNQAIQTIEDCYKMFVKLKNN